MIITINDLKWEVVVKTHDDMPNKPKDTDNVALGRTYETTLRIYLNKEVDKQVFRTTLIHELTHAYIFSFGFTQVVLDDEVMCDFLGAYADSIVRLADSIIKTLRKEKQL